MPLSGLSPAFASAARAARDRPAFALFLAALATLPFKWLSPLGALYERAAWTDVFIAGAALLWVGERLREWRGDARLRPQGWQAALVVFLVLAAASAALSADPRGGALNVLLMAELVVIAVLAADFGSSARNRSAIGLVVMCGALATATLAAAALALFYLDVGTGLVAADYGELRPSEQYARVKAGFHNPTALASYCIFAAAVVAMTGSGLPRSWQRVTQWALGVTVVTTFSRAVIGFLAAVAVRAAALRPSPARRAGAVAVVAGAVALMGALTLGTLELDPTRPTEFSYRLGDDGVRYRELTTSLRTAWEHPLVGIGPGELPGDDRGKPTRAHFTPVNIAATVGFPALAALLAAVVLIWRRRTRPADAAIWAGLLGLAIDGMGQDVDHFRHVWILLGLAAARRPAEADPPPRSPARADSDRS